QDRCAELGYRQPRSVAAQAFGLNTGALAMSHGARESLPVRLQLTGYDERIERLAADLFTAIAEHAAEFPIDPCHPLVQIKHDDGFGRTFEQFIKQSGLYA